MNKHGFILVSILVFLALAIYASEQEATEKAMQKVLSFKDKGFVNVRGERRGYLAASGVLDQKIKMFANQEYLAVVAGDSDLEKVSISVLDHKGAKVASSAEEGPITSVLYTPKEMGKYTFSIQVPGKGGYYQFSLVTK